MASQASQGIAPLKLPPPGWQDRPLSYDYCDAGRKIQLPSPFPAKKRTPEGVLFPFLINYLRSLITKQCIKILIKADSTNESVLP